jgi:hypothetical protein
MTHCDAISQKFLLKLMSNRNKEKECETWDGMELGKHVNRRRQVTSMMAFLRNEITHNGLVGEERSEQFWG